MGEAATPIGLVKPPEGVQKAFEVKQGVGTGVGVGVGGAPGAEASQTSSSLRPALLTPVSKLNPPKTHGDPLNTRAPKASRGTKVDVAKSFWTAVQLIPSGEVQTALEGLQHPTPPITDRKST